MMIITFWMTQDSDSLWINIGQGTSPSPIRWNWTETTITQEAHLPWALQSLTANAFCHSWQSRVETCWKPLNPLMPHKANGMKQHTASTADPISTKNQPIDCKKKDPSFTHKNPCSKCVFMLHIPMPLLSTFFQWISLSWHLLPCQEPISWF